MSLIQITEVHPNDAFFAEPSHPDSIVGTICKINAATISHPSASNPDFTCFEVIELVKWANIPTKKGWGNTCFHGVKYITLFK